MGTVVRKIYRYKSRRFNLEHRQRFCFIWDLVISDDNDKNPSFHADANFEINGKHITGILANFHPCSYNLDLNTSTKEQSVPPYEGFFTGILNKDHIKGKFEIDIGIKGSFDICKFESDKQKKCDEEMSWKNSKTGL